MKFLNISNFTLLLSVCSIFATGTVKPDTRIVRGQRAKINQFPYLAALNLHKSFFIVFKKTKICVGSIISFTWILTAAHCTHEVNDVDAYIGSLEHDSSSTFCIQSGDFIVHPQFSYNGNSGFDIALIKTPRIYFTESIQPIRLPSMNDRDEMYEGKECTIAGWGYTSDAEKEISDYLNFATMKVVSFLRCGWKFINSSICAAPVSYGSTCNGDSGGPLITANKYGYTVQIGVYSKGQKECEKGLPVIFDRLSNSLDWIKSQTRVAYYD